MAYKSKIGRADLARLLAYAGHEAQAAQQRVFARLLGFESLDGDDGETDAGAGAYEGVPRIPIKSGTSGTTLFGETKTESQHPKKISLNFWHIKSGEFHAADKGSQVPPWFKNATPITRDELLEKSRTYTTPPHTPLMPWSRLWPFLRKTVSKSGCSTKIDVLKLIDIVSRCKPIKTLPRTRTNCWPHTIDLLIDRSNELTPFFDDMDMVSSRLERMCGKMRLKKYFFPFGIQSKAFVGDGTALLDYKCCRQDSAVLALTDLGFLGNKKDTVKAWNLLGMEMKRNRNIAIAFAPCPPLLWEKKSAAAWSIMYWDLGQRSGLKKVDGSAVSKPAFASLTKEIISHRRRGLLRLQRLLSPVLRLEVELVRQIRLLLPYSETDAAMESDVWMQRFDCKDKRDAFHKESLNTRKRLLGLIGNCHSALWEILSEELATIKIIDKELAPAINIEEFIENLAATLENQKWKNNGFSENEIMAWFAKFENRIPSDVWRDERMAVAWVMKHRTKEMKLDTAEIPVGLPLKEIEWALQHGRKCEYRFYQHNQELVIQYARNKQTTPDNNTVLKDINYLGSINSTNELLFLTENRADGQNIKRQVNIGDKNPVVHISHSEKTDIGIETSNSALLLSQITKPSWAKEIGRDKYGLYAEFEIKGIRQRMRWINPGRFLMGSPENEPERDAERELQHEVILTKGFWIADTACTQELWQVVMGENPSNFKGSKRPVEQISWSDCKEFLERINSLVPDLALCFPTEAQWEYACRAGTTTPFSFGENITPEQVNYNGDYPYHGGEKEVYREQTVDVKSLPSNQWGLYEMHGNVWEWCDDRFGEFPKGSVTDPVGLAEGPYRVLRGGSWFYNGRFCRSADRNRIDPGYRGGLNGFRFSRGHQPHGVQPSEQAPDSPERSEGSQARRSEVAIPNILLYKWHKDSGEDEFGTWLEFAYKQAVQRMRWIKPGKFLMGSPENEPERYDDEKQHEVILTKGFWLADTACTQGLWQAVMRDNPSRFKGANRPVENVSWNDCGEFLKKINGLVPDISLCLPTEAQWEYACRAGTTTPFSFGDNITPEQVNYDGDYPYQCGAKGSYREQTVDVKSLPSNQWGLYEMHGNVWEWCDDRFGEYPDGSVTNPDGPAEGLDRVLRGGSWFNDGRYCRSAERNRYDPGRRRGYYGFRFSRGHQPHGVQTSKQAPDSPERSEGSQARRSGLTIFNKRKKNEG